MKSIKEMKAQWLLILLLSSTALFAADKPAYEVQQIIETEQLVSVVYQGKLYALGKGDNLPGTNYYIDAVSSTRIFLLGKQRGGEEPKQAILEMSGALLEINTQVEKLKSNELLRSVDM